MIRYNILTNEGARENFIEGCRRLKAEPLSNGLGTYDYFPWWHHRAMMVETPSGNMWGRNAAHQGPVFGPWHRLLLLVFEFQMRRVLQEDNFRLPYWNWGADAGAPFQSPVWSAEILGGSGTPVTSGPFRQGGGWTVQLTQNGNSNDLVRVDRGLRRNFGQFASDLPANPEVRGYIANNPVYATFPWADTPQTEGFRIDLEIPLHNTIHRWVSGDMMTTTSPNDPVFFLHHANIDRIWSAWQTEHPNSPYVPDQSASTDLLMHRIDDRMHSFLQQEVTPRMMLDHSPYYQYDTTGDVSP